MSIEEFKQNANLVSHTNNMGFNSVETETFSYSDFKIIKKTYHYCDYSSQSFISYYFEDQEVSEAIFLTHLSNYKI